jgi:hypothetical protein
MIKKIAVFKSPYNCEVIGDDWAEEQPDYVRLTAFVVVNFQELPKETVITNEVKVIDAVIDEIKTKALQEVEKLLQRKSELLELSHETESH